MFHRRASGQGGFTLVELLVVVAILGTLAGVAVFAVGSLRESASVNACRLESTLIRNSWGAAKASPSTTDTTGDYLNGVLRYFVLAGGGADFAPTPGWAVPPLSGCTPPVLT